MKCIIVDDELMNIDISKEYLQNIPNYHIRTFLNPKRALDYLQENWVDCVLLDWKMPEIDGPDFISTLKNMDLNYPMPKIVMCTGVEHDKDDIKKLAAQGIFGYIIRPFTHEILTKQIRQVQIRLEEEHAENPTLQRKLH